MIATALLCVAACGQVQLDVTRPRPKPARDPKAVAIESIKVGSVVKIGGSHVGASPLGLNYLVYLTYHDPGSVEGRKEVIDGLARNGMAVELAGPTRVIVQGSWSDPKGTRSNPVFWGRVIEGPAVDIPAYFFASQVLPDEVIEPPGTLDEKKRGIYQAFRKALRTAKGEAARVDLSIRKRVLAREEAEAIRGVAKKFGVALGELEEIVRLGEIEDGRAARREEVAFQNMLKARNQAMLNAMSRQLNAQLADVLKRADAQASARMFYPPSNPAHLGPGFVYYGPLGKPLNHMTFTDGGASVRPLGH